MCFAAGGAQGKEDRRRRRRRRPHATAAAAAAAPAAAAAGRGAQWQQQAVYDTDVRGGVRSGALPLALGVRRLARAGRGRQNCRHPRRGETTETCRTRVHPLLSFYFANAPLAVAEA